MGATPFITTREAARSSAVHPAHVAVTAARPAVLPAKPKSGGQSFSIESALGFVIVLGVATLLAYSFSILVGSSVKETARRETIKAAARAQAAQIDMENLRQATDRKTTFQEVARWASANRFNQDAMLSVAAVSGSQESDAPAQ